MPSPARTRIQVMDTTLRDGEQTPEISYTPAEKLQLAQTLLDEVGVDRIEIAGTRVSEGEREAARQICAWAKKKDLLGRIEMLGYVDGTQSVDWLESTGGRVLNLLTKGSERHCLNQLRMPPEQHRKRVADVLAYARKRKVKVNVYLEDWSQGVKDSPDYVFAMMRTLTENPVERVYLADTLGIQSPKDTRRTIDLMVASWPDVHFEFHCHNDYGLATANCLAAVEAGARGVHTSVNGLGERAGNTRLAEVVAALHDHGPWKTGVNEKKLVAVSRLVEIATGKEVSANAPIVGADVFTQTAGIHADGDATGRELAITLHRQVKGHDKIRFFENCFVLDLVTVEGLTTGPGGAASGGRCAGAITWHPKYGLQMIWAKATILASGGCGQVYRESTNPPIATGDGLAIAYRAGATLADMAFVQFHPTTLYVAGASRSLITEAVRGEGARLIDRNGYRFMPDYHPMAELAPRDIVARAILAQIGKTSFSHVFLDCRHIDREQFAQRFPSIFALLRKFDIDPGKQPIPVHPSAHYMVGGVRTDAQGRTNVAGLYACGEVAANGLHGANRLGANRHFAHVGALLVEQLLEFPDLVVSFPDRGARLIDDSLDA